MVNPVDPTSPILPSENLRREIEWTDSHFRCVALRDKRRWARFADIGHVASITAGFVTAVLVALSKSVYTSAQIDVLCIVLPACGSAVATALLQTRAVAKQRGYEMAWQDYDHLLSSVDQRIAAAKGLQPPEYEAVCSEIATQLIDGRRTIERRLIRQTSR